MPVSCYLLYYPCSLWVIYSALKWELVKSMTHWTRSACQIFCTNCRLFLLPLVYMSLLFQVTLKKQDSEFNSANAPDIVIIQNNFIIKPNNTIHKISVTEGKIAFKFGTAQLYQKHTICLMLTGSNRKQINGFVHPIIIMVS